MDRGTERPTCPEEGRPESLSKNSWEEKLRVTNYEYQFTADISQVRLEMAPTVASVDGLHMQLQYQFTAVS